MIREFLETGRRPEGFRTLLHRARKLDLDDVREQIDLIDKFLRSI